MTHRNKMLLIICSVLLGISVMTGCSKKSADQSSWQGTWYGIGNALNKGEDYTAQNLTLTINDDNSFTLKDSGADSPLWQGTMDFSKAATDGMIAVQNDDKLDSSSLLGWQDPGSEPTLKSHFINADTLALTYQHTCYIFQREIPNEKAYSLYEVADSDFWFNNDGNSDDPTYELSINDSYMEIYLIKKSTPVLVSSLIYSSHKDDRYTFYADLNTSASLPPFLEKDSSGAGDVELSIKKGEDSLTITGDGREMTFRSDIIFGIKTGSDTYALCDHSFTWRFDGEDHFCFFALNPDTDRLTLYVTDSSTSDYSEIMTAGTVSLNETDHTFTYQLDEGDSRMATDSILDVCRSLSENPVPYTLAEETLTLKIDGTDTVFNLSPY